MKAKTSIFYAIAIALPFALLLLLELILRLSGFGQTYPLFVPAKQIDGYLMPNPDLIKRYFGPNGSAPQVAIDTFLFTEKKPANTIRIVTMGGSTMAGFPYGRFASPAGMLKQRFKAQHPTKNIEIISVAMSSINSYTLLDISEEVIGISPDAVLIYAGHNEYLGVMGVASNFSRFESHAANLLFLKVKDLRIFQLMQGVIGVFTSSDKSDSNDENNASDSQRTVMAHVAKNKSIVYDDDVFRAGVEQFSQNIDMILSQFSRANVPVFISNLVANESDLPPFESVSDSNLDSVATKLLNSDTQLKTPIKTDDVNTARDIYHANYFYGLGKRFAASGDLANAKGYFTSAKDFDLLRFRAPSMFNQIIKDAANKHGAVFVDTDTFIREQSAPIIGSNLMLEHLHPNHRGYFLLSESFYLALSSQQASENSNNLQVLSRPQFEIDIEQAWQMSPISKADEIFAEHKIAQLTSDYPFSEQKQVVSPPKATDAISRIALARINGVNWIDTQQALLSEYQRANEPLKAANIAGVLFDALPDQAQIARVASLLYLRENSLALALYYATKAVQASPNEMNYRLSLAEIYFKLGEQEKAKLTLQEVIALDSSNQRAKQILQQISN